MAHRPWLLLLCFFLVAAALPTAVQAQAPATAPPVKWQRTDMDFPSFDGTVLAASKWVPDTGCPCPAIVETNGWNNRHDQGSELRFAERYASQGYYVFGFTSRGWGNSGGEIELDGPKEQNDTRAVIDFLAKQPEVQQDGPGDPHVGMIGESYAGGIQLLAAQGDPRIDTIVPLITWNNLLDSLAPHDVFKIGWVSELYATGQTVGRGAPVPGQHPGDDPNTSGPSEKLTEWYLEASATNAPTAEMRTEIGLVRSVHPGQLKTPTLLMNGWGDTLFQPSQALMTYEDLHARGVPVRLVYFPGGHGISLPDTDPAFHAVDQVRDDWFNVTLRGHAPQLPPYPVLRYRYGEKDFVGETQWPPAGTRDWTGYLGASGLADQAPDAPATLQIVNPVGPTTCGDVPSFQSDTGSACPHSAPETSTIVAGPALDADAEVAGTPMAHLIVSSTQVTDVRLFLTLVDVDAAGTAVPILKQTMPVRLGSPAQAPIDVAMQPIAAQVAKGHHVGLQIATTDLGFFASREPGAITISSSKDQPSWLTVPFVPKDAWGDHTAPLAVITSVPMVQHLTYEVDCMAGAPPGCGGTKVYPRFGYDLTISVTDDVGLPAQFATETVLRGGTSDSFAMISRVRDASHATLHDFATDFGTNASPVTFTFVDFLGNTRNVTWSPPSDWQEVGCAQGVASLCPQVSSATAKGSPGFEVAFLVASFAVLLAIRRRRD